MTGERSFTVVHRVAWAVSIVLVILGGLLILGLFTATIGIPIFLAGLTATFTLNSVRSGASQTSRSAQIALIATGLLAIGCGVALATMGDGRFGDLRSEWFMALVLVGAAVAGTGAIVWWQESRSRD